MGSSRLPGKVMADINGQPAMSRLITRLSFAGSLDDIVIATTVNEKDDILEDWGRKNSIKVYRGSEEDVLNRVVRAADSVSAETIVEINGDCILTDPVIVDEAVSAYQSGNFDVVTNCGNLLTYPMGVYAQVFSAKTLSWVDQNIKEDVYVREHVSIYFYENMDRYRVYEMVADESIQYPNWRFHLDYPEDLEFLREIYKNLEPRMGDRFTTADVVAFLKKNQDVQEINKYCAETARR